MNSTSWKILNCEASFFKIWSLMENQPTHPSLPPRKKRVRLWVAIAVVAIVITAITGFLGYEYGFFSQPPDSGGSWLMHATCASVTNSTGSVEGTAYGGNGIHAYFLIVEADPGSPYAGLNGSALQSVTTHWPIMHVHRGQLVSIHVINCAASEAHGFEIQYYDDNSIITVRQGQAYDVTFNATETGTFRVFCDVFCLPHPQMQNGELIVS